MTSSGASFYAGPPADDYPDGPLTIQPIIIVPAPGERPQPMIVPTLPQDPFSTAVRAIMTMSPEDRVRLRDLIDALNK